MDRSALLAIIEKAKQSGQKSLYLSSKEITELPEEIGQLTNLTSLFLSHNQLTALPESICQLTNLTLLDLSHNKLTALPESSDQLTNLTLLDLGANELTALPESICQLTNLTLLKLDYNQLTALPGLISQLTNLTSLELSHNQLASLPKLIGQLTSLTSLNLNRNQLTTLPESIGQLTNLTFLGFKGNRLTTLPKSIVQITNLESLDFRGNQVIKFPEWVAQLVDFNAFLLFGNPYRSISSPDESTSVDLSNHGLTILPEWIGRLENLTTLDLRDNQLTMLPGSMSRLSSLTSLNLRNNQLTTLPEWIGQLINLTNLDIRNNQLTKLPVSLGQLRELQIFYLNGNQLNQIPSELLRKGGIAIRDYYRQRLEESTDYIYEAKLLIIGEGGAGKTSLANKLIDSNYKLKLEGSENPEKSTEGIDVLRLDFPHPSGNSFRINVWDFGGQEIYHSTHQFFLTKRSLYLLIADTRQDNTDFNYWLEIVELLSQASPTLIVKNEKQDRPCEVNENQLRGRFPNLEKILSTNLSTNRGLPKIRDAVKHYISQLPHIGTPLPKTWVNVRKALETETRNHITQTEFLALCDTHGFKRHADKLQLSGYLHDLGVCLHFQDDPILKNVIILKPEWGTTAVYKVLDTPQVRASLGSFTPADLATIWADAQYAAMRHELLQLMKNCNYLGKKNMAKKLEMLYCESIRQIYALVPSCR
jgi:internalin A